MTPVETLKQDLKKSKPFYGVEVTLKKLRAEKVSKIYLSNNCTASETIKRYATQNNVEVVELDVNNVEVGVVCKRPHSISVLCFA